MFLPRLIDIAMRNKDTTWVRADWAPRARGDVLEVGIGSGLNLPFYSAEVSRVYAVDPSPELQRMARKRMAGQAVNVEFLSQSAEQALPLPDQSVDTVVITWTLCSIADPSGALRQMRRVLKPSGRLILSSMAVLPIPEWPLGRVGSIPSGRASLADVI